jgi:uroporphyrinogen decarboxylase
VAARLGLRSRQVHALRHLRGRGLGGGDRVPGRGERRARGGEDRACARRGLGAPSRLDPRKGILGQQVEALRLAARELGGGAPILQTVFSPLTTARKLAGERVFADMRREPEALEAGLRIITDVTIDFALASLEAGAHGFFLATQCASYRVATEAEYLRFGKRYDLEFYAALKGKTRLDLLHVHGEDVMFDLLADYPVSLVNWHDRLTAPTLRDALKRFPKLLVGGVEENRTLTRGPHDAIRAGCATRSAGGGRL